MPFIEELKRRNVFRVGIAYLLVAWLVLQVTDNIAPILDLPSVFNKGVLLLLVIGFPIALVFAWAFELTPDGVKKEQDVDHAVSIAQQANRKLDLIIIGVFIAAVTIFSLDKLVWVESDNPTATATNPRQTIAVLPFVNMSDDSEQEYFSDGLSEELLNLLAQIPELRVTSRTSAFSFKGKDATIPEIGRVLGVQHVLEGSVRRSGGTIRVTAQLIEAATDKHVWSDTWDRNFEDVFVIQDEIAEFVVDALKVQLLDDIPRVFETTPEAYELYLRAQFLIEQPSAPTLRRAESTNQRVLDIDPDYIPAWTQRAHIFWLGPGWNTWPTAQSAPLAREAALKSLQLFERNADARAILAQVALDLDYDYEVAGREINIALNMGTDSAYVFRTAAEIEYRQGNLDKAIEYLDKAHAVDPVTGRGHSGGLAYTYSGRYEEGISIWEKSINLSPDTPYLRKSLAMALFDTGDIDGALAALEKEPTEGHRLHGLALIYEGTGDTERSKEALENLIANSPRWTYEVTEVYAYRGELDEAFEWVYRAIERRDRGLRHVMASPYMDKMRDDPRFDEVMVQLGLKPEP